MLVTLNDSRAQDSTLVVEGLNMAAGAAVNGNWIDGLEWVRNFLVLGQSDQQFDVILFRRDKSLTADWGNSLLVNSALTGSSWKSVTFTPTNNSGISGIIGYSCRFSIKNSAAVANTFARAKVQFLGL